MAARYRPVRQSGRPFPVRRTRRPPIVNGLRGRGSLRGHADESPYPSPQRRRPALFRAGLAAAQQTPPHELSPVIVTAQRVPSDAATLPVAVSVITAEDIAASSARTMQDLLSTQAGIHLLNTSSSTDNAIVDLRGFGMTGASNTLILVDGVKQNTNDLSAPNLGVVPLDQVERIEIVRGSGSVQYGGGTGGVINIITRRDFSRNRSPPAPPPRSAATACASTTRPSPEQPEGRRRRLHAVAAHRRLPRPRRRAPRGRRRRHHAAPRQRFDPPVRQHHHAAPGPARSAPDRPTGKNEFESDPRGAKNDIDRVKTTTTTIGLQVEQVIGAGTL